MKKVISMLLALAMVFSLTSVSFAAELDEKQSTGTEIRVQNLSEDEGITVLPICGEDGIMPLGDLTGITHGQITATGSAGGYFTVPQSESGKIIYFRFLLNTVGDANEYAGFNLSAGGYNHYLAVTDSHVFINTLGRLSAGRYSWRLEPVEHVSGVYDYAIQFFTY